ncbi:leucine-rich repeat LRR protein [Ehrlichia ruminantium]|uniref:Leucine-rich repeat LRR protein n=1 Tax=Ehrlichia ruminantium TaxID=779 RepID=A0A170QYR6_EHRRU|nr:leucine-rich repeat LRR protein [Ehrlichia ruminantium]GAT77622.1 leucine-rich repeat LRR protein [Ehrlichia ruminantium]
MVVAETETALNEELALLPTLVILYVDDKPVDTVDNTFSLLTPSVVLFSPFVKLFDAALTA